MTYFLSIDYGGTNTKSILFDKSGRQLAVSAFATLKVEARTGFREVELDKTWDAIQYSIRDVLNKAGIKGDEVAAVACIGHGKGLYILDREGREFTNGILSTDTRASQLAQDFETRVAEIWPMTRQHVVAVQNPVLLRWLKDEEPEIYRQIGAILSAKDYVRFKLTGKINQEYGDASGNHWINFETGTYDPKILAFFGIEEMATALPDLVDYSEIVGGVTAEVAAATSLVEGTPVVGGLFDIDACAIGSGVLDDSAFSVIAGTWNINIYPSTVPAPQASGQMNSYFPTRQFLVEESSPTSAGNLDKMIRILLMEEINHEQENKGNIYETLEEFLIHTDAKFSKLIFFPFLYGSNSAADAQACFFGLSTMTSKSEMIRAVYEGIIFAHKQHIIKLMAHLGRPPKVLRLSGGATNSPAWVQMFADALNLPVETLEATELGGLGGAIACLQATEQLDLVTAIAQMVKVKEHFEPKAVENASYEAKYKVYQELLQAMQPAWQSLSHLRQLLE